jgi:hypothetical protein
VTKEEFQREMDRLASNFRNAYSPARQELIAKEVKDLSAPWWKRTVDRFIGEFRQAPLLPEIREAIAGERERLWDLQKKVPLNQIWEGTKIVNCGRCFDTGHVLARRIGEKTPFAFICDCEFGRKCRDNMPPWEQMNQGEWEIIR